jgi:hypothetical protein
MMCSICNQPGKMKNTSGDSFIALSKSIQITVINDPIYTFGEVRFNLMIELESGVSRVGLQIFKRWHLIS